MLRVLINLLTPIFGGLGVSAQDVASYVTALGGYIYAIFGTLLLAVAVMVAAHWVIKKETRPMTRWTAGVAWVLITTFIANIVCFGPLYNNLAPIMNGAAQVSPESMAASRELIKETGEEGMVLAKNNGILPMSGTKLNVFGWASTNPIYGGTGSGSADNSNAVDILQSLKDAGIEYNQELVDMYTEYSPTRNLGGPGVAYTDWSLPEPTVDHYTDALMNNAKEFSDTAMIVISRSGGEGQDEPTDMYDVIHGTYDIRNEVADGNPEYNYFNAGYTNNGDYDDFDKGESYLELSHTEKDMISKVCSEFSNVFVVINANNTMELGWVNDYDSIGAVILAPGTGASGMAALGEIINGSVNPSGRTADTFVYDLSATPSANNVGSHLYNNVDDLRAAMFEADNAFQGVLAFVDYVEGIYVGYRFYETAAEEGLINYDDTVLYPFGHGLSYTTFEQKMENFADNGDTVSFDVTVTNTGAVAGKDVVEVYYTPPYTNGGIEKASVNLVDFEKTDLLDAGASQTISFSIPKEDMASYDAASVKAASQNGGYVLESGNYTVSIRSDSHTVIDQQTFHVAADIDYSANGRSSDLTPANNQFEDYSTGNVTFLSRADHFANYAQAVAAPLDSEYAMSDEIQELITEKSVYGYDPTRYDSTEDTMPTTEAKNGLKLADYVGVDYDDPKWDDLLDQLSVKDMTDMVNLGGFQTVAIDSVGKVLTQDSDGTSGLNDWYIQVYGTAYSTELLIAQTWNKDLAYRIGVGYGQEYADAGIYGCYGPAMNTHRSAFCGRNFEYYSEDGVLAGKIASNTVNGMATKGVYAYIKHFVLNDQETNRCCLIQTFAPEQAIREIYMKPFELCVKSNRELGGATAGYPLAVMSSFNFIGHKWSGANSNLLNNVLRGEWGFKGFVLTDWDGSYGYQNTDDAVRNGNDAMLGFYWYDSNIITDTDSATLVTAMRQAAKNIMFTVVNSGNYTNAEQNKGLDKMTTTFIAIDAVIVLLCAAIEFVVVKSWLKKRKA